jgi:hypothetical protein
LSKLISLLFSRRSVKTAEPSMYLDLKFDQTRVIEHFDESSDSDVELMVRKKVVPKKSLPEPSKISLQMEEEIENSPVHTDMDSDAGDLVTKRKRTRKSRRKTINEPEINVRLKLKFN